MTVAILIEVMETFSWLSEEWVERKQYCMFKAGYIMKSLNDGKKIKLGKHMQYKQISHQIMQLGRYDSYLIPIFIPYRQQV